MTLIALMARMHDHPETTPPTTPAETATTPAAELGAAEGTGESSSAAPADSASSRAVPRTAMKSQKLNRTLKELESAFTDWEELSSCAKAQPTPTVAPQANESSQEQEFRAKTKKLLSQLREQLAELND